MLEDISICNFLNRTPNSQEIRVRIDKWDSIKFKSFCTSKEKITRIKIKPTGWKTVIIYSTNKR
jgi:hypothetical protein